jgi:uncharacterized membrane protein
LPVLLTRVLVAVIIVGILLRCVLLSKESLWFDELMSWWLSVDFGRAIQAESTNPPVYLILLHGWSYLFGVSETAMRAMSIIPSVAAVFLTWRIAKQLLPSGPALVAAAYQSISAFHIFYAQEARTHALLLLMLTACFGMVLKATASPARRWMWLTGYALLAAAAMYTHFVATFYLCMHALFVVIVCRRDFRAIAAYAASAAAACALFSPWLIKMLHTASGGGQFRRHLLLKVPQTYFSFLFGDALVPMDEAAVQHIRETLLAYGPTVAAGAAVAAVAMIYAGRALAKLPIRTNAAIILLGVGPVALSLVISLAGVPMFDERYVLSSTPFVYMAVALGMVTLWEQARAKGGMYRLFAGAVTSVYVFLLVLSLWNYYRDPRFGKEQWREVIAYVESATGDDSKSLIVFEPDFMRVAQDYYGRRPLRRVLVDSRTKATLLASEQNIRETTASAETIWLIRTHERDDLLLDAFRRVMREQSHREFPKANGIDVYQFSRRAE